MRKTACRLAAALLLACGIAMPAAAQFPDRPVLVVRPYTPGTPDVMLRAMSEHFQRSLGHPLVVTHREGASGVLGMRIVAAAAADGYTLGLTPITAIAVQPHLLRNAGIGPDNFEGVCGTNENVITVAVRTDSPIRDLPSLVAEARKRMLAFGSPGPNSLPQLAMVRVQIATGIELNHIPYRGEAAHINDTLGGRLDFSAGIIGSTAELVRSGRMRLVAVMAASRHPDFPSVPTAWEQGIDVRIFSQVGLYAPKGTPPALLDRLEATCRAALEQPNVRRVLADSYTPVSFVPRGDLTALMHSEYASYGRLLRDLGVQAE